MKRRAILLSLTALTLSACGFQLRGSNGHGNLQFKTVYLGGGASPPLAVELRRYIRASGETAMVEDPKAADATLEIQSERRDRATLSLDTQGKVRDYSLYYRVRFAVRDKAGKELLPSTELALKRDITFNESQVIAKEKEEEMLYRDMQSDVVQQILRRMSMLKPV
jgi:LPS-assembly lipoprotein